MHRRVLVGHLPGLHEIAQRVGQLVDRPRRGGGPRAVAGYHQNGVERAGQAGSGGRVGLRCQGVAARWKLLSRERAPSPLTIPLTVGRARSICSVAARTLTSSTRLVTWLVSVKPSARITANDIPSVRASTRSCNERRQATPRARLNVPMPRIIGPERPERPRKR